MPEYVERVKVEHWTNRDGEDVTSRKVTLVSDTGQREVPCYAPEGADLIEDAALPEGWEVKISKAGNPYLAPPRKAGGGQGRRGGFDAAWRNTEAGFKFEQERMDRRTALMQSVAIGSGITTELAEKFYRWLRAPLESVGVGDEGRTGRPVETWKPAPTSSVSESGPATGKGGNPDSEADTTGSEEVVQPRAAPSDPPRKLGWDNRYPEEKK